MRVLPFLFAAGIILMSAVSCTGLKAGGSKGAKTDFETFFVGEQGTQYFIHPLEFKSEESELELDITLRYKDEIKDSATINFSILSAVVVKKVDSIFVSSEKTKVQIQHASLLFNEKKKKLITSRFTGKVALKDVTELFKSAPWKVSLKSSALDEEYDSKRKANRVIKRLQETVFVIF